MGRDSAAALLAFFATPLDHDPQPALIDTVSEAIAAIDLNHDTTKGAAKYERLLRQSIYQLRRPDCPWSVWIKLSAETTTAKTEPIAAPVRRAAADYAAHPDFHADIRAYTEGVLEISGLALKRFQALKTEAGLIDFSDMEQLTLHALDDPTITSRLTEELELLLVDEFQDTNPMQLALFVKLAQLADRVILVGDVKQAIYAFRGCDPDLVFKTLDGLTQGDAKSSKLENSWRSRPALVHYVNEVFAAAFAADEITRDKVILEPVREEQTIEPAVLRWDIAGGNKTARAGSLAQGIADLVAARFLVSDPESNESRPIRWGDIAVLSRTNANVEAIARTLKDQRVPMKMTLAGLFEVPEVCLAKACLRRLNDFTDTLATAEILALADSAEPESWLADRLTFLAAGEDPTRWAEADHPIIRRLKELRPGTALASPVEIVARVLNDVGVRQAATGWGPDAIKAAQRQRNLDAFLNLAVEYEHHCEGQHEAATLTGFLFWVEHPSSPELDLQPVVTSGDAVHVLTYHRAKGLEWPVVIATDFDRPERTSLWNVRVNLTADFDVNAPLAHRSIRFWPNPFGGRTKNLPTLDRILASAEGLKCAAMHESEERRLAYVGMTRARDALIIALPEKAPGETSWLQTFASDFVLPDDETLELPNGQTLDTHVRRFDGEGETPEPLAFAPRWFAPRPRRDDIPRESVNPSGAAPFEGATIAEIVELGARIELNGGDMTAIGSGLHAVIAAELVNPDRPDAVPRASAILTSYGVDAFLAAGDAVAAARRFRKAVEERFKPMRILIEYPISETRADGRFVRGWIDALIETEAGWVIIDHKSSPRPKSQWDREVLEYSGQLATYAEAVQHSGLPVVGLWIHFPVTGGLVRLALPD
jgi:ATP-dependent exoDNAse (exonuclease V) beta subunit